LLEIPGSKCLWERGRGSLISESIWLKGEGKMEDKGGDKGEDRGEEEMG